MSEQVWFIYHDQQQLGPFTAEQVRQLIDTNMIAHNAYLFKVGWKDWRPIEDVMGEIGASNESIPKTASEERWTRAPRATIGGRVVIHNGGKITIGTGVNISSTGIFVETTEQMFVVGEKLKLSVRAEGIAKPFNAFAEVVRYSGDSNYAVGYGLRFCEVDKGITENIQRLVNQRNQMTGTGTE